MQSEQRGVGERQLREWERVRRADETRLQKRKAKGKERSEEREREDEVSWVNSGEREKQLMMLACVFWINRWKSMERKIVNH